MTGPKERTLQQALTLIDRLDTRSLKLERDVKALRDILNVHDNWPATIRELKGRQVRIKDQQGEVVCGIMRWSDRYTFCVEVMGRPRTYSKGGFTWIEPHD